MGFSNAERRPKPTIPNSIPKTQSQSQGKTTGPSGIHAPPPTPSMWSMTPPIPSSRRFYMLILFLLLSTTYNVITMVSIHVPSARRHSETTSTSVLLKTLRERDVRFKIESETVVYDRYARVYSRNVRFPTGQVFSFDVWGRVWKNDSFTVVAVVPFDRVTQTFTLIREYNPAHGRYVYSFPQGMVERSKHTDVRAAAEAELEEEAHLKCLEWIPLFDQASQGVPQDKYQREVVFTYLCADSSKMDQAAHADDEEYIEIVSGITSLQVRQLCLAGVMQSNNIAAGLMAIDQLRHMNLIPHSS